MKLDIENHLPEGVKLTTGNPEYVSFDGDKSHVIMRFAVKPLELNPEPHAELKAQYMQDVETCKSVDGLESWELWQWRVFNNNNNFTVCDFNIFQYDKCDYRRHPHADNIIAYHRCSDADKRCWQNKPKECVEWAMINGIPNFDEDYEYRLKPCTI